MMVYMGMCVKTTLVCPYFSTFSWTLFSLTVKIYMCTCRCVCIDKLYNAHSCCLIQTCL